MEETDSAHLIHSKSRGQKKFQKWGFGWKSRPLMCIFFSLEYEKISGLLTFFLWSQNYLDQSDSLNLLTSVFVWQFSLRIGTYWINFDHWWVLGFFAGVPWSQTCFTPGKILLFWKAIRIFLQHDPK